MIPDIMNIDTSAVDTTLMGINMSPSYLVWTTIVTLVISHIGANYLKDITPR
jgi:hypothetical protein